MGDHMKTTVDISDSLLEDARRVADRRGVTLRTVIEEGLRHVVTSERRRPPFQLRDASFRGEGLQPEFEGATWDRLRDAAYGERGA